MHYSLRNSKETIESVRFRHWISDDTCLEGEAKVTVYAGSHNIDEFGIYDGDEYNADIEALYEMKEGCNAREIDLRTIYSNPRLLRAIQDTAIEAIDFPPALPVIFPGEQAPSENFHEILQGF